MRPMSRPGGLAAPSDTNCGSIGTSVCSGTGDGFTIPGAWLAKRAILPPRPRRRRATGRNDATPEARRTGRTAMTDETLPRRRFLLGAGTVVAAAGVAASGAPAAEAQTVPTPANPASAPAANEP